VTNSRPFHDEQAKNMGTSPRRGTSLALVFSGGLLILFACAGLGYARFPETQPLNDLRTVAIATGLLGLWEVVLAVIANQGARRRMVDRIASAFGLLAPVPAFGSYYTLEYTPRSTTVAALCLMAAALAVFLATGVMLLSRRTP
jgi:hypothetical protein